ncbi:hypothetical protein K501DRAFT_280859 [Backusella circina FSU 941]|nr:hypothetical protein K501DRAFT_280859 [Backusella circina FSU 941]
MTTQKVAQPMQNPTSQQSKNKRKKNRRKNKKSAENGLAAPIANSVEPNVTSHANDLSPQKAGDHRPIDKESVPVSAVEFPMKSSFLSELSTELDLAFESNSFIDEMDQANTFKPSCSNGAAETADVPEKGEASEQCMTSVEESIKPNLVIETEPVTMETLVDDEKDSIDTLQHTASSEHLSQAPNHDVENGKLESDITSVSQKAQEENIPVLDSISTATIIPHNKKGNEEDTLPIPDKEEEPKEEKEGLPKNDPNIISAAEESFPEEQMDKNGGGLSDESKNKSSEFPLCVNSNDLSSPPALDTIEKDEMVSDAVSFAIHSVIASKSIDSESIVQRVVHDIEEESGKYKMEPKSVKDDVMQDGLGSRTVVSSNVYKNEPSIEVNGIFMEGAVQCPEPAVGSTGQRMPSSMRTADTPKITSSREQHQRKSTFAAALRRRNCIIL